MQNETLSATVTVVLFLGRYQCTEFRKFYKYQQYKRWVPKLFNLNQRLGNLFVFTVFRPMVVNLNHKN